LDGALEASRHGIRSSLHGSNAAGLALSAESTPFAEHAHFPLLFDPQTSGGLLAGVAAAQMESCLAAMHAAGYPEAAIIGQITAGPPHGPVLTFS
jgi:selenide,water dikinase